MCLRSGGGMLHKDIVFEGSPETFLKKLSQKLTTGSVREGV